VRARLVALTVVAAPLAGACGLLLDLDPPDERGHADAGHAHDAGDGTMDAGDGRAGGFARLAAALRPPADRPYASSLDARVAAAVAADDADVRDATSAEAGPACPERPCRLVEPQCGCAEPLACQYDDAFMVACLPAGDVPPGGHCVSDRDCVRGHTCLYLEGDTPNGVCAPFCIGTTRCGALSICVPFVVGGRTLPAGACSPVCDPLARTGCATPLACDVAVEPMSGAGFTYCRAAGASAPGDTCGAPSDCAAGTTCIAGSCKALCVLGGPCVAGGTCAPVMPPITIGSRSYGICLG
jgi:hypothetical protein